MRLARAFEPARCEVLGILERAVELGEGFLRVPGFEECLPEREVRFLEKIVDFASAFPNRDPHRVEEPRGRGIVAEPVVRASEERDEVRAPAPAFDRTGERVASGCEELAAAVPISGSMREARRSRPPSLSTVTIRPIRQSVNSALC